MVYIIHTLLHVLTAVVAVAICMMLGLTTPSPRIVEIDSDLVMQRYAKAMRASSDAEVTAHARKFLRDMDEAILAFAVEHGVVVVDTDLAIAGAVDVTDRLFQIAFIRQDSLTDGAK